MKLNKKTVLGFVCACAVALACASATAFAADGGKTYDLDGTNYMTVQKTFSGIDADQIPSGFTITATGDKATYTLTSAGGDGTISKSSDGLTWTWTISNAKPGTYSLSESGQNVANHTVATSGLTSGTVAPGTVTFAAPTRETPCNHRNWDFGMIFASSLTANDGIAVITDEPLSAAIQTKLAKFLTQDAGLPGCFTDPVVFGSISEIQSSGQPFSYNGHTIDYDADANQLIIEDTHEWQQIAISSMQVTDPQNPSFAVSNKYTYHATGSVTLSATKAIDGRKWRSSDSFDFALFKGSAQVGSAQTVTKDAKTASFTVSYDESDIGKTYNYTIKETSSMPKNMTAGDPVQVSVKVTDENHNGKLTVAATYENDVQTITNVYRAAGSLEISASKQLTGRSWLKDESYTFTLYSPSGTELSSRTVTGNQTVTFDTINFTQADLDQTYVYTISETSTLTGGVKSSGDLKVSVSITEGEEAGTLAAIPTYENNISTITNTYSASGKAVLAAAKKLEGRSWKEGETFTFTLYDENKNPIRECKVSADGTVSFDAIDYNESDLGKTYRYTVEETSTLPGGMTKSGTVEAVVTITDVDDDGVLEVNVEYVDGNQTIINSYKADPTQVEITAHKILKGGKLQAGQFFFSIYLNGEVVATGTNDADGLVTFPAIKFEKAGSYELLVKEEVVKADKQIKYDTSEYIVTVDVVDDGDGNLVATVSGADALTFKNVVNDDNQDSDDDDDDYGDGNDEKSPKTGDSNPMKLFLLLVAIGMVGMGFGAIKMRRAN